MEYTSKSIRPFIGAKNYNESRRFYQKLGFEEVIIDAKMSLFKVNDNLGFYLQDYYAKEWVDNSMIFLEVEDIEACQVDLLGRDLLADSKMVRMSEIRSFDYGKEIFLHDPSGVLWHFCEFKV